MLASAKRSYVFVVSEEEGDALSNAPTNRCRLKLKPRATIKSRVEDLVVRTVALRRKDEPTIKATKATPGHYVAARPLEIVQIDHTRVDVVVVDEETREPIGRPWITLAIDLFTRMVTGFHLTMAAPSRLSTGLALLHAVHDKTAWLREREIEAPWPVAGLPETLHSDNGSDFRSRAFVRACRDSGIKIIWRIPGEPHYGGHIERLIGTVAFDCCPAPRMATPPQRAPTSRTRRQG